MATYKDMIELIGKFKHVPEVLANPSTAYNKFNYGGSIPKYTQGGPVNRNITNTSNPFSNSTSMPTSTTSVPMSSTSSTPAPPAPPAGKSTVTNTISQSNLFSAGAPNSGMQSSSSGGAVGGGGGQGVRGGDFVGAGQAPQGKNTGGYGEGVGSYNNNPYNTTMNAGQGNLLSGDYGGNKYSPDGMASGAEEGMLD